MCIIIHHCTPGNTDGSVTADVSNPAVNQILLAEILQWREDGCTEPDVVDRLRRRTVPDGYPYETWQPGSY